MNLNIEIKTENVFALVKEVLVLNQETEQSLKDFRDKIVDDLLKIDSVARSTPPSWLERELKELNDALAEIKDVKTLLDSPFTFHVALAAIDYSFISDEFPRANDVNFEKYASIIEQEISLKIKTANHLADTVKDMLAVVEEQKHDVAESASKVDALLRSPYASNVDTKNLIESLKKLQSAVDANPIDYEQQLNAFNLSYKNTSKNLEIVATQNRSNTTNYPPSTKSNYTQPSTGATGIQSYNSEVLAAVLAVSGIFVVFWNLISSLGRTPKVGGNDSSHNTTPEYNYEHTAGGEAQSRNGNNNSD